MSSKNIETLDVLNSSGKKVGSKELSSTAFGEKPNRGLLHQVVRWQRNKIRSGTHSVKTRSEVARSGVKPWKQKGTGRARAGSARSPLWVGGGIAHGPKPRKYDFDLNKQERKQALQQALSVCCESKRLVVVDKLEFKAISTKVAVDTLKNLGINKNSKILIVRSFVEGGQDQDDAVTKSLRNIPGVRMIYSVGLNVYDILNAEHVVVVGDAIEQIQERLN